MFKKKSSPAVSRRDRRHHKYSQAPPLRADKRRTLIIPKGARSTHAGETDANKKRTLLSAHDFSVQWAKD